ncbi:13397_t:CDS:2, partial [Entrophospora sp. SA101]
MSNPNNETTGGVSVDEHENGPKQCIQYEVALVDLKEDIIKKEQTLASKIRDHDKLDKSAKEETPRAIPDIHNILNTYTTNLILIAPE